MKYEEFRPYFIDIMQAIYREMGPEKYAEIIAKYGPEPPDTKAKPCPYGYCNPVCHVMGQSMGCYPCII